MEGYEITIYKYDNKIEMVGKTQVKNPYQLLLAAFRIIYDEIGKMEDSKIKKDEPKKLTLTKEECLAIISCPFMGGSVNEENYPGYNEAVNKIYKFTQED